MQAPRVCIHQRWKGHVLMFSRDMNLVMVWSSPMGSCLGTIMRRKSAFKVLNLLVPRMVIFLT